MKFRSLRTTYMTFVITALGTLASACGGEVSSKDPSGDSGDRRGDAVASCIAKHSDEWPRDALAFFEPESGENLCLLLDKRLTVQDDETAEIRDLLAIARQVEGGPDFGDDAAAKLILRYFEAYHLRKVIVSLLHGVAGIVKAGYVKSAQHPDPLILSLRVANAGKVASWDEALTHYEHLLRGCVEVRDIAEAARLESPEDSGDLVEGCPVALLETALSAVARSLSGDPEYRGMVHVGVDARSLWHALGRVSRWKWASDPFKEAVVMAYHAIGTTPWEVVNDSLWPMISDVVELGGVVDGDAGLEARCFPKDSLNVRDCWRDMYFDVYRTWPNE